MNELTDLEIATVKAQKALVEAVGYLELARACEQKTNLINMRNLACRQLIDACQALLEVIQNDN